MATVTPSFSWPVPQPTDLVKDGATAIEALGDAIDASMTDLRGGTTGQILAKATNADMDFAWITNDVGDITEITAGTGISGGGTSGAVTITNSMATEITAKGDLIVGTGSATFDNLAAGTNNHALVADSTTATGLAYKQQGLTLITSTAFSGASTVAVDSVFSSTYANYLIELVTTSGSGGAAEIQMRLRASGSPDVSSNYYNAGSAYTYAAATENAASNPGTSAFVMRTNGSEWVGRLNVYNPQATNLTWWLSQFADTAQSGYRGGYFNQTTSFTGIQFFNTGATNIAGTIRIYGMAN